MKKKSLIFPYLYRLHFFYILSRRKLSDMISSGFWQCGGNKNNGHNEYIDRLEGCRTLILIQTQMLDLSPFVQYTPVQHVCM